MAENVIRNMEILIDDIIEVQNSGLFNDDEVNILKKRLMEFQHRLNKPSKQLQDFKDVITFEKQLLRETRRRKNKSNAKVGGLENVISRRVSFFYDSALRYYSGDLEFSMEYLDYLSGSPKFYNKAAQHVGKMMEKFPNEPTVFQKVAAWYKSNKRPKDAIRVLTRGLTNHKQDQHLYLDIIEIELSYPNEAKIERFKTYVDVIAKNIPDCDILIYIMSLLEMHPRLHSVLIYIMHLLMQKPDKDEKIWHTVAIMELKGHYYEASPEELSKKTTKLSIQRCIDRYKKGIAALPKDRKSLLWSYYIDTLVNLQNNNPNVAAAFKMKCLKNALEEAHSMNVKLEEEHWKTWINICGTDEEMILNTLAKATASLPKSLPLWLLYLKFYLLKQDEENASIVFERAISNLGSKAVPIWDLYITAKEMESEKSVLKLYSRAVSQPYEEVSQEFKVRYLKYMCLRKWPADIVAVYLSLASEPPYCKKLHEEMITLIRMESKFPIEKLNQVFELYSQQFGDKDIDVWLNWIYCTKEQPDLMDKYSRIAMIYQEAIRKLPELEALEFKDKYNEQKM